MTSRQELTGDSVQQALAAHAPGAKVARAKGHPAFMGRPADIAADALPATPRHRTNTRAMT